MVGDDILQPLKPPGAELVQHLPFVRDQPQYPVKSGDPVGGDQGPLILRPINIAHLSLHLRPPAGQVHRSYGVRYRVNQLLAT